MEEKKKYFLFADECGDSNLSVYEKSFPVFTLCGIIVSREQIRKLEKDVKALKERIWGTDDIILHSYEIRHLKKAYLPLKDKAIKQDFYKGLDRILGENGAYIIVSSTVLKDEYTRKYGKLGDIYSQALTFLLERAVFYVDDVNPEVGGTIDAMLERRGKVEDKKLSERYNELREKGTYWVTPERPNPAFDIIKGNIYVSDGKELGIKVIK